MKMQITILLALLCIEACSQGAVGGSGPTTATGGHTLVFGQGGIAGQADSGLGGAVIRGDQVIASRLPPYSAPVLSMSK
jgi:hypothetical protein